MVRIDQHNILMLMNINSINGSINNMPIALLQFEDRMVHRGLFFIPPIIIMACNHPLLIIQIQQKVTKQIPHHLLPSANSNAYVDSTMKALDQQLI
jgi:hypothetical protein